MSRFTAYAIDIEQNARVKAEITAYEIGVTLHDGQPSKQTELIISAMDGHIHMRAVGFQEQLNIIPVANNAITITLDKGG